VTALPEGTSWIEPGRLLVGRYPERVEGLAGVGVTLVIDLTEDGERPAYAHLLPAGRAGPRGGVGG
jgi:hypothetical protein